MKTDLINSMTRSIHRIGFKIKKHSPEILMVAGTVGVVASGVMACRATLKVNEVLEQTKTDIDSIHEAKTNGVTKAGQSYSEEDSKKDLAIVYTKTGVEFVKLYAPSVVLAALSLTAIISSHNILHKRNVALAAAYTAVDKGFKDYRNRVVERFGKDLDRELRYNIKTEEVEERVVDENGEEKVVKKTIEVAQCEPDVYSKIYDDGCTGWTKSPEHNLVFLKQQQDWCNRKLQEDGFLFLNDVYQLLGFQKTKMGQVVGWVYDPSNPKCDSYVDFGIYDIYDRKKRDFVNGYERNIRLDFNVDGNVWDLMQ